MFLFHLDYLGKQIFSPNYKSTLCSVQKSCQICKSAQIKANIVWSYHENVSGLSVVYILMFDLQWFLIYYDFHIMLLFNVLKNIDGMAEPFSWLLTAILADYWKIGIWVLSVFFSGADVIEEKSVAALVWAGRWSKYWMDLIEALKLYKKSFPVLKSQNSWLHGLLITL